MKRLSESIWSNINKRSEGNIERKEDDVDLMDGENFAIYLNKRYSFKNGHKIEYDKKLRTLTIPGLYTEDEFFYDNVGVDYENDSMTLRYMWINDPALTVQVRSALKKRYNLSSKESSYIFISPLNGGELTNKFVVNVLDYMADLDINDINIKRTVNESIWSNINKRSEGRIERKEDQLITNIKEIEPVDLGSDVPVYFADRDLEVNGEIEFTWDEVLGFILQIEKTGWELPTGPKGMQYLFYFGNQPPRFNDEDYKKKWIPFQGGILTSRENNVELHFPSNNKHVQSYWCADDDYKKGDLDTYMIKMSGPHVTARSFEVGNPNDYFGCLIRTNNQMVNKKCRIRLIRDK